MKDKIKVIGEYKMKDKIKVIGEYMDNRFFRCIHNWRGLCYTCVRVFAHHELSKRESLKPGSLFDE